MLPAPETLTIYPSALARDRALRLQPGEVITTEGHVTLGELLDALGQGHGRFLLTAEAVQQCLRALMAEDPSWAAHACDPYAVRAVSHALAELRTAGLTAGHLGQVDVPEAGVWTRLLATYEGFLAERGWTDAAEASRFAVAALLAGSVPLRFQRVRRVEVLAGVDVIGLGLDFAAAWRVRGAAVRLHVAWDPARPHAFVWTEALLHARESRDLQSLDVVLEDLIGDGALAGLRRAQWTADKVEGAPVRVWGGGRGAHVEVGVAATVKAWLGAGVPADEIAVGVVDAADAATFAAALRDAGIAAYASGGRLVDSAPARTLLRAVLLSDLSGGLRAVAVVELLQRCGHWWRRGPAASLGRALHEARIRRLDREGLTRIDDASARHLLEAVAAALEGLPAEATALEQVRAARAVFEFLWPADPPSPARESNQGTERVVLHAEAQRAASRQAVAEVLAALEAAAALLPLGPPMTRSELHGCLQLALARHNVGDAAVRAGAVRVLPIARLVGCQFRHVVLAGVGPGPFAPGVGEQVLGDSLRRAINRRFGVRLLQWSGSSERDGLQRDAQERTLWLHALASATDELTVFYAADEGGVGPLVEELLRSTGLRPEPLPPPHLLERPPSVGTLVRRCASRALGGAALVTVLEHHCPAVAEALRGRRHSPRYRPLGADMRTVLEQRIFGRPQSVSKLDTLGKCAFRYFSQVGLGLKRTEATAIGASERDEGQLGHAVLHRVYVGLQAEGGLAALRRDRSMALRRARAIFDAVWPAVVAELSVHSFLADALREWAWWIVQVQLDRDLSDVSEPRWLEYGFGDLEGAQAAMLALVSRDGGRTLQVRGSIDRIDEVDSGFRLIDYKRTLPSQVSERSYQLPLYARVAQRELGPDVDMDLCWIELGKGKPKLAVDVEGQREFVARAEASLWQRLERVLSGDVAPDPLPGLCDRCDYRALCRIEETAT